MSASYNTEPPPTARVLVHTTAGPLYISLFAQQCPLTCRNFLQHCLDGTYYNLPFHRVVQNFIIQTGDPTGTGDGGTNIYEDGDAETEKWDATWVKMLRLPEERIGEQIVLGDEMHSRLKFNRRGLLGMARMTDEKNGMGQYGGQWFITLGDTRQELEGKCTLFGRVESDAEGIFNVLKIASGELINGSERPVYPEKITGVDILEMPKGEGWNVMQARKKIVERVVESVEKVKKIVKKRVKGGLSFGGDEDEETVVKPKKKFNPALIDVEEGNEMAASRVRHKQPPATLKRKSPPPRSPSPKRRKPSFHESTTQLPLRNTEQLSPSRSPSPPIQQKASDKKSTATLEDEIFKLKQSMRRDVSGINGHKDEEKPKSMLESFIPTTSTRGKKRPRPGESRDDSGGLAMLNAFKSRLENGTKSGSRVTRDKHGIDGGEIKPDAPDEEAELCDLHFIANCQSCSDWVGGDDRDDIDDEKDPKAFLSHSLTFEKDRLGKDLSWKRKMEDELVLIDPREEGKHGGLRHDKDRRQDRDRRRSSSRDRNRDRHGDRERRITEHNRRERREAQV